MSDVTIVTCYNNEKVFNDFADNLKTQTYPYELIGIDNRGNNKFSSASRAYNSVINQVKTKYVIYSHQDIIFTTPEALAKFVNYLEKTGPDDILGVAGTKFDIPGTIANIMHRDNLTGKIVPAGNIPIDNGFMECDTVGMFFLRSYGTLQEISV